MKLSIAIMYKNHVDCLERCIESIQNLRKGINCELVMADSGSTDGSRAIAEKFADILFDIEWVNDFSIVRNALLEKCTGEWCLMLDTDEWLDENNSELISFLKGNSSGHSSAFLIQRNYQDYEFSTYSDSLVLRLMNMKYKPYYSGALHSEIRFGISEGVPYTNPLSKTIIHHDGYVGMYDTEKGIEKARRDIEILKHEMKKAPESLKIYMELLDCGQIDNDYEKWIQESMELIDRRAEDWEYLGQVIYRNSIQYAVERENTIYKEWYRKAQLLFPNSYYINMDGSYLLFAAAYNGQNHEEAVKYANLFLEWQNKLRTDEYGQLEAGFSGYRFDTPNNTQIAMDKIKEMTAG